jgi:acetyltransferase-like isoleucine patch superfamily enzyme
MMGNTKAGNDDLLNWAEPEFDEMGMTQWGWRVSYRERFRLGKHVEIGSFTMIDAREGIEVEDDVKIGFGCIILSHSSIDRKSGPVVLRKGCKIGANTVVMPNTEIGENAVIGANSFVNHDVPQSEIWVGSPARFYKRVENEKE